jgi:hypothetical protein
MEQVIEVSHMNGGWRLCAPGFLEPTLYLSERDAEQAARRLACGFAITGCDVLVHIHDLQDLLVADHHYFGA